MGGEFCHIDKDEEELNFLSLRINKIENLDECKNLKRICLRNNLIDNIENLDACT